MCNGAEFDRLPECEKLSFNLLKIGNTINYYFLIHGL